MITKESNLSSLESILTKKLCQNYDEFNFKDYLDVLKMTNLVSDNMLTKKEEELVTRSWHQISFFQNGNIVSNSNNIRTFISGILGMTESWMYKVKY